MKRVYGVIDTLSDMLIGPLVLLPHDAPAVRLFTDLLNERETVVAKHPKDHALVCFGYLTEANQLVGIEREVVLSGETWLATQTVEG